MAEVGRPTKYNQEMVENAKAYLESYEDCGDMIPSIEGLAIYLGIARSTVYKWAEEEGKEDFSYILEDINTTQKRVLINKGLSGEFNSNITKLALGKHGYSERQQQEISGPGGTPVSHKWEVEFINATQKDA